MRAATERILRQRAPVDDCPLCILRRSRCRRHSIEADQALARSAQKAMRQARTLVRSELASAGGAR